MAVLASQDSQDLLDNDLVTLLVIGNSLNIDLVQAEPRQKTYLEGLLSYLHELSTISNLFKEEVNN
jgi:hypothetical protein